MGFGAVTKSLYDALAGMFKSDHVWTYESSNELRRCNVCGRHEELALDIMSTDWHMIEPGDAAQHAAKPGVSASDVPVDSGVYAASLGKPGA